METKTTNQIIIEYPIRRVIMMPEQERNYNKNKRWVAIDDVLKLLHDNSITSFEDLVDTFESELTPSIPKEKKE